MEIRFPCKHRCQIPAAVESSGVPFQGGGGARRTFRVETQVESVELVRSGYGMPLSLSGEQSKEKQEGVSRRVWLRVWVRA